MRRVPPPSRAAALSAAALAVGFSCAIALTAGCDDSTPLPGSASSTASAAAIPTCSSDPECAAGFQCDRELRQCVCTSDAACPSGQFCNAFTGLCVTTVPGCTSDAVCAAGQFCNRALRTCQPLTTTCGRCSVDAECGPAARCAANPAAPAGGTFCSPSCSGASGSATSTCPASFKCSSSLCVPKLGTCDSSNACVPDSLQSCTTDSTCADLAQVCDQQLGKCVAKVRLCPPGDSCDPQQSTCATACAVDTDCAALHQGRAGWACRNNACFPLQLCVADADCPPKAARPQVCLLNLDGSKSCKNGCVNATDCPLGQSCNGDASHPKCVASCTLDADCPLNQICTAGGCSPTCSTGAQACQTTSVCGIGQTCAASGAQRCCLVQSPAQLCAKCVSAGEAGCAPVPANPSFACDPATAGQCDTAFPAGGTVCDAGLRQCVAYLRILTVSSAQACSAKGFRWFPDAAAAIGPCKPWDKAAFIGCATGHF